MSRRVSPVVSCLRKARKLLSKRERWTQGWFAFARSGLRCDYDSPNAVCFCSAGAVGRVADNLFVRDRAMQALEASNKMHGVAGYNDAPGRKHSDILRWFDRAIRRAEREARAAC